MVKTATYQVGAEVEAKVKGWKKHYKGRVTAFDSEKGTYSVEFEDGDKKDGVKGFNIRALAKAESFTAPDGKAFDSRAAYRKYMSETFYSFKGLEGQTLVKKEGEVAGQTFNITGLAKCEVQILDHSDQVLVDGITDCKILIGPSSESVFVRNAKNCHLFIACKQFRCRDCQDCTVSLYSKTEPVVETSSNMRFYPYKAAYPNQAAHFAKASLPPEHNHWCNVFDFNKGDASIPEPHWSVVPEGEDWAAWDIGESAENPVPSSARATVEPRETGFAIGISQEEAEASFKSSEAAGGCSGGSSTPAPPAQPAQPAVQTPQAPSPTAVPPTIEAITAQLESMPPPISTSPIAAVGTPLAQPVATSP